MYQLPVQNYSKSKGECLIFGYFDKFSFVSFIDNCWKLERQGHLEYVIPEVRILKMAGSSGR